MFPIRRSCLALIIALGMGAALAQAATAPPSADLAGASDSPLLKRYEGSIIISSDKRAFDELALPLGPLECPDPKARDAKNNRVFQPKIVSDLEGAYTRLVYLNPPGRSSLEVLRNYQDEVAAKGGEILYQCKGEACGGDPARGAAGGGGEQSLMMKLVAPERVTDDYFSPGGCALQSRIRDQRYFAARIPADGGDAYLALMTWVSTSSGSCRAFNDRAFTLAVLIEPKAREQKMVTVKAAEMASNLDSQGRIALYGVHFDFDKAVVKPESRPTLQEIAALLAADPALEILVVGHTDNQGGFAYNVELSQRRAQAVVKALTGDFGVAPGRLTPFGAGMAAPTASNDSEEGRAKNRRVELVKR
ncbi:OmpA/MotB domain protein [Desulfarculus baarsii DSM 2075]|uniref:OmpA/MotB domain protein n=1 Tax=Desulfarculus baarsii (strain ATCC 33931 / DSM 2075 / LMG 7858 / VKM B-1802 / 2st14) TaxID=644282 RepID=E1QG50_DESB2|nr:OmpA family protein [Desulfarculus baarsii]ADK83562.1 OmpA/MotB domain protein [Desulfarculus baarsii DSM 2075]